MQMLLAGDSTVSDYPAGSADRGWGEMLPELLVPGVIVRNFAKPGRSTKTFRAEGLWTALLDAGRPGDVVLIQFGHNDSHAPEKPESTDAATAYTDNLRAYVAEARQRGLRPILVTPMHRRIFQRDGMLTDELRPYVAAMLAVAAETKTPCVDLYRRSGELFQSLGDDGSADLSSKPQDRTHFSAKGARAMAGLVGAGLREAGPGLERYLREP